METIAVIIMIILFLILMAFVFSTALLTPLIGKKNLLFVVALGFVVGIIGGAFFISPVFSDIPDMARYFYQSTSNNPEIVEANISTDVDVNKVIADIKNLEGVKKVDLVGITLKTTPIPPDWKKSLESRATTANANITSLKVETNDTILVSTNPGADPPSTIKSLKNWILLVSGIDVSYSIVQVQVQVDPAKVDEVTSKMPQLQAAVTGVQGPMEENISGLKNFLPSQSNIIILCGVLGAIVGLAGVFIDTILQNLEGLRKKISKR
ncbi:MAG TPA: hypothetical protein VK444_06940 [Methanobacteriaceae archaeon]|nr:hypothetical protein [Methanobacteriaceae archaeon]